MSPRYDPILNEEVPTEEEKFLKDQFRDVREEVQFLRAALDGMRRDQNEWSLQTNKNLVSIGKMISASLTVIFLAVFSLVIMMFVVTNKIAPDWLSIPWWN